MVFRVFVEKKPGLDIDSAACLADIRDFLRIKSLTGLRRLNRYDVEGIDEKLFDYCVGTVFSEPSVDNVSGSLNTGDGTVFAVEYLPGQYDQRADSAAQCIQIISCGERPVVRTAKVYVLTGALTEQELATVKKYFINPVECREAALGLPQTLKLDYDIPQSVPVLDGFNSLEGGELNRFVEAYGLLWMPMIFASAGLFSEARALSTFDRNPHDKTYWSDHCRHTDLQYGHRRG